MQLKAFFLFKLLRLEAAPNEARDQIFFEFNERMVSKPPCLQWLGQLQGRCCRGKI